MEYELPLMRIILNVDLEKKKLTDTEAHKTVLMVVDVQVGFMRSAWDADRIISNIAAAVEKARRQAVPVIWVQHSDNDLVYGSADWQMVPELTPRKDEFQIHKQFYSSFEKTKLEEILSQLDAKHIGNKLSIR